MQIITFDLQDQTHIDTYDGKDHTFWNNTAGPMLRIRANIRNFYLLQQNNHCCYCKMLKQEDHGLVWDVEHIIPKAPYPQFLFEPYNLAVSCKECNISKDNQETLVNTTSTQQGYPMQGDKYLIIHPHFDNYDEHIEVIRFPNGKIIHCVKGDSKKGKETFNKCNLFRFMSAALSWNSFNECLVNNVSNIIDNCPIEAMTKENLKMVMEVGIKSSFQKVK